MIVFDLGLVSVPVEQCLDILANEFAGVRQFVILLADCQIQAILQTSFEHLSCTVFVVQSSGVHNL